jgi:predicted dehydrogenase
VIFCEKPVCRTRAEFLRLRELEKGGRARVIVNHSRRFDPAHQELKRLIAASSLGALVQGHVDYYGGWRHLGVHVVDILQFLFEKPFEPRETAFCCASKYVDDPTLHVVGTLGGAPVRLTGFPEEYFQILDMTFFFARGQIRIADFGQSIEVSCKTVNAAGENVLVRDDTLSGRGMRDPMVHAVNLIARYLAEGDGRLLDPYGLAEAGRTMDALWKGSALRAA